MNPVKQTFKKHRLRVFTTGAMVKYFKTQNPIWIDFRITYRCNLRCSYCDMPAQNVPEMTTDEIKTVIDKINAPGRVVLLTGGEPLVRNDIGAVVDYFVFHSDIQVRLNTNLLLLKKKYDEVKNCDGFFFSLDGAKATHEHNKGEGSWKGVEEGLQILHGDRRGKISMTVITSSTTLDDIEFVLDLCTKYEILPAFQQVRHYTLSRASESIKPDLDRVVQIFTYLAEQRKKGFVMMNSYKGLLSQVKLARGTLDATCYSGKLLCSVDSDGMVGLCFSRPRHNEFISIRDKAVSFDTALKALNKVKNHVIRCQGCTCMAPIEFSLCNLFNVDVLRNTHESDSRFAGFEEAYIKRMRSSSAS